MGWLGQTAWLTLHTCPPRTRRRESWLDGPAPALLSIVVLVGAFVVVAIAIGVSTAAAWVAFGISIVTAMAGVALAIVALRQQRRVIAWLGALLTGLATWTVIATAGFFSVAVERWIAFGSGIGYAIAAVGALGVHELNPARVVHVLEVRGNAARG